MVNQYGIRDLQKLVSGSNSSSRGGQELWKIFRDAQSGAKTARRVYTVLKNVAGARTAGTQTGGGPGAASVVGNNVVLKRNSTQSTGRSGGFIKGRKKVAKFRKSRRGKILREGVSKTCEFGTVFSATPSEQIVTIGHISHPAKQCQQMMWGSVIKLLLKKAGFCPVAINEALPLQVGDKIYMQFRVDEASSLTSTTWTSVTGGESFDTIALWFADETRIYQEGNGQYSFEYIQFQPVSIASRMSVVKLDLIGLKIKFDHKSTLKMQNVSRGILGVEADDVDNVPLYGMDYYGKGTGPQFRALQQPSGLSFVGAYDNGLIQPVASTNIREPIQPSFFQRLTKYGKVKIEPGIIKTSTLVSNGSKLFNDMFNLISTAYQDNSARHIIPMGKFRFVILEKMIDAVESGNIIVNVEHNLYMAYVAKESYNHSTLESFEKAYL